MAPLGFVFGMGQPPQSQIDRLFGGDEVWKYLLKHRSHDNRSSVATRKSRAGKRACGKVKSRGEMFRRNEHFVQLFVTPREHQEVGGTPRSASVESLPLSGTDE